MTGSAEEVKPYLQEDDSKKDQVRRMFDNIAPHYDLLNRILSAGTDKKWRKKAISKLHVPQGAHVLDVATGTGDLAFEVARQYDCASITGLDIAENMLEIARSKSVNQGTSELIEFVGGDSENLPFESNSYDGVTVAFGVRNFGNLKKGLNEINRVMKTDGTLVVLEFTRPRSFPFKQIFQGYFKYILPLIGKFRSGDPRAYKYLYESVQAFPDYDRFEDVLKECGFRDTNFEVLTLGICAIYTARK